MFDLRLIAVQLDGRVLAAMLTLPDSTTMEAIAAAADTTAATASAAPCAASRCDNLARPGHGQP